MPRLLSRIVGLTESFQDDETAEKENELGLKEPFEDDNGLQNNYDDIKK